MLPFRQQRTAFGGYPLAALEASLASAHAALLLVPCAGHGSYSTSTGAYCPALARPKAKFLGALAACVHEACLYCLLCYGRTDLPRSALLETLIA